ncbi:hypothetical protein [Bacteroides caecimuris]|jgi:hypothetical protein|nr:hypothetical protein [Bacteroides caecimuris]
MFNNGEKCPSYNYFKETRNENACDELEASVAVKMVLEYNKQAKRNSK